MKINIKKIINCPLFNEINEKELESLILCLNPIVKQYPKDKIILSSGEHVSTIGVVLSGKVQIIKEDFLGNRSILSEIGENGLFAETFPFIKVEKLPVTVISATDTEIMFIGHKAIICGCESACGFHSKLIENMIYIIAKKNMLLNKKIEHISERTTREKLLSYLSSFAQEKDNDEFSIPFNRQELADYLCVERSAMSNELSKMQRDGIIEYNKNHFKILK